MQPFQKKYGWTLCGQDKPSTKAPLLLLESWVVANISKMMPDSAESKEQLVHVLWLFIKGRY